MDTNPFDDPNFGKTADDKTYNPFDDPNFGNTNKTADAGFFSDAARLAKMGANAAAQDVRELVGNIPLIGKPIQSAIDYADQLTHDGKSSDQLLKDDNSDMRSGLSPSMKKSMDKKWWDQDAGSFGKAWSDPKAYESGFLQSLPEQALMMFPAMRLAKGAYAAKEAALIADGTMAKIAGEHITAGATDAAANTAAKEAVAKIASDAAAKTGQIAGTVIEGGLGGAQSSRQVRDDILNPNKVTDAMLHTSDAYQSLINQGNTPKQARKSLADDRAMHAFITAGVATGVFGGLGDRLLARIVTGAGQGVAKRFAMGALSEGVVEEFPQSYLQQVAQNQAMQGANKDQPLTDDALNQAMQGAAVGALQGGGMAAISGHKNEQGIQETQDGAPEGESQHYIDNGQSNKEIPPVPDTLPAADLLDNIKARQPDSPMVIADSIGNDAVTLDDTIKAFGESIAPAGDITKGVLAAQAKEHQNGQKLQAVAPSAEPDSIAGGISGPDVLDGQQPSERDTSTNTGSDPMVGGVDAIQAGRIDNAAGIDESLPSGGNDAVASITRTKNAKLDIFGHTPDDIRTAAVKAKLDVQVLTGENGHSLVSIAPRKVGGSYQLFSIRQENALRNALTGTEPAKPVRRTPEEVAQAKLSAASIKAHNAEIRRLADEYGVDRSVGVPLTKIERGVKEEIKRLVGSYGSEIATNRADAIEAGVNEGALERAENEIAAKYDGNQSPDAHVKMLEEIQNKIGGMTDEASTEQKRSLRDARELKRNLRGGQQLPFGNSPHPIDAEASHAEADFPNVTQVGSSTVSQLASESKPTAATAKAAIKASDIPAADQIKLTAELRKGNITPEDVHSILGEESKLKNKKPLQGDDGPIAPSAKQTLLIPEAKAVSNNIVQTSTESKQYDNIAENSKFNLDLESYLAGGMKSGRVFILGNPGVILSKFGLSGLEIQMPQSIVKKGIEKHSIDAADLRDLPMHIQNPLAVFASKTNSDARILLTEITHPDGNLVVALHAEMARGSLVVHDIRSIHPKPGDKIAQWVEGGLLLGVDKKKGRYLLPATLESNSQGGNNEATSGVILYEADNKSNDKYTESKKREKLWGGSEPAPTVAGQQPLYADTPEKNSGQGTPIAQGQNSNDTVSQLATESKPAVNIEDFGETKEADKGVALYSRGDKSSSPSDKEAVDKIAQPMVQGLARVPELVTVQSVADLPFAAPKNTHGALWHGKIYLVADNLGTHEAIRETIAHELYGHFGLRGFFGDKLNTALNSIHVRNPMVAKLAKEWLAKNADIIKGWKADYGMTNEQVRYRSLEEAMSEIAQTGKTITGVQRLASVTQSLLRKVGLHRLANKIEAKTDAEAMAMLHKAGMFIRRGIDNSSPIPEAAYPLFSHGGKMRREASQFTESLDQSAAKKLNKAMAAYFKDDTWENAYVQNTLPDALHGIREAVKSGFDKELVGITPTEQRFDGFDGVNYGGYSFINLNTERGFINIAGHELFHSLEKERPDLHAWFKEQAQQYYKKLESYRQGLNARLAKGEQEYTTDKAENELLADFTGDALADPKFLAKLAEADGSKFRQLLRATTDWLKGVSEKLKGNGSDKYITDVEALRKHLVKVLVTYSRKDGIEHIKGMDPVKLTTLFSRRADNASQLASQTAKTSEGMTSERVTQATAKLRAEWRGFRRVKVVQSIHEIPDGLYFRALRALKPIDQGTEGLYDPPTRTVYLIADNIATPERAVWVAAHEVVGHGGIRMLGGLVGDALDHAAKNGFVSRLAKAIAVDRGEKFSAKEHTDEAIAELAAATVTGKVDTVLDRYGIKIPVLMRTNLLGRIKRVIEAVRNFVARTFGKPATEVSDGDIYKLLQKMKYLAEGKDLPNTQESNDGSILRSQAPSQEPETRTANMPSHAPIVADFNNDVPLKQHADFKAAKAGDIASAFRLVADLVKPENISAAKEKFGSDVVYMPVMAQESSGKNQIPNALAAYYAAKTDGIMGAEIFQTNKAYHTGADAMERLIARSEFSGRIAHGQKYVLVDDVSTMGGTLADMASYIQSKGGVVSGAVLLTNASRAGTMTPEAKNIRSLGERHGQAIKELFGIDPSALTRDEAQYLVGFRTTNELRNRAAKASAERSRRIRSKALPESSHTSALDAFGRTQPPSKFALDSIDEGVVNTPPSPLYSRAIPPADQMSSAQIAQIVEERIGHFAHQPPIHILDTEADSGARPINDGFVSGGAVLNGAIHLFRDGLSDSADVSRTLIHELLHYGLRRFMSEDQYISKMSELYMRDIHVRKIADSWVKTEEGQQAVKSRSTKYARARGVDEALAEIAEQGAGKYKNSSLTAKTIRTVSRWVAKVADSLGFKEEADKWRGATNDEARDLIKSTFGKLRNNAPAAKDSFSFTADPSFSRSSESAVGDRQKDTEWGIDDSTRMDDIVYKLQDKNIDLKRVIEAIKESGKNIPEKYNTYLQEELFHGRAAKRTEDFLHTELQPLLNGMRLRKISDVDLDEYLHARHAKEANALIAERDPNMQDGGSGMTDKQADDYMSSLEPSHRKQLDAMASQVDKIIGETRDMYVSYGLIPEAQAKEWAGMFNHYVPLMREDNDGGMGVGQGFSIKGKEVRHRTGSNAKVVDILANIALQREKVITRGEKNRVTVSLAGLVKLNPNPDFWHFDRVPTERVLNEKTGLVEDRADPMFKSRENVIIAKIADGHGGVEERAIVFNEHNERAMRMARAMKNLDATQLGGLLGVSAKITRYFASINTQYNPVFGLTNILRDTSGMALNLSSTPIAGKRTEVLSHILSAVKGIYLDSRAERQGHPASSKWAGLWEEMQDEGGMTGYRDLYRNSEDRANAIRHELDPHKWTDSKWGQVFTAGGVLKVPLTTAQDIVSPIFDWLSDYNQTLEGATRLSAYKVAIDHGMSTQEAASLAKNITVNFNRKGQAGQQAGALYAFFNASMQGTARIGETMFDMQHGDIKTIRLNKAGKVIMYGGIMLGVMQAVMLAAAGFDDNNPPQFIRERNIIIPIGNKNYISIPMPLGYHILPNIGRVFAEYAMSGMKDSAQRVTSLLGVFADGLNPIGNSGLSMQTIAPTALDPFAAIAENKDWTGKNIAREDFNSMRPTPGFSRNKDTATWISKTIAEGVNYVTGGDKYKPGVLSPTADQIDYLAAQVGGGVWREAAKAEQFVGSKISGEELPTYKIPVAGKFYGDASDQNSQGGTYYFNLKKINEIEAELKGRRKDRLPVDEYKTDNPEYRLIMRAKYTDNAIRKFRKQKSDLLEKGGHADKIKLIDAHISTKMKLLNDSVDNLHAQ